MSEKCATRLVYLRLACLLCLAAPPGICIGAAVACRRPKVGPLPAYRPAPPPRPAVVDNEFGGDTFYTDDGVAVHGSTLVPSAVSNGLSGECGKAQTLTSFVAQAELYGPAGEGMLLRLLTS